MNEHVPSGEVKMPFGIYPEMGIQDFRHMLRPIVGRMPLAEKQKSPGSIRHILIDEASGLKVEGLESNGLINALHIEEPVGEERHRTWFDFSGYSNNQSDTTHLQLRSIRINNKQKFEEPIPMALLLDCPPKDYGRLVRALEFVENQI